MKRTFALGLLVPALAAMTALLGGCPVYDDDDRGFGCYDHSSNGNCNTYCNSDYDCPNGYSCSAGNVCVPTKGNPPPTQTPQACSKPTDCPSGQNCGSDKYCHTGNCSQMGCPTGYECTLQNGAVSCTQETDGGTFNGCRKDSECASLGAGSKCLSGTCTKPGDQCSDQTQCKNAQCVQGVCTPSCDGATKKCPTGYSCDTAKGVCTGNPAPCGSGQACSGTTTCVQDHCVDKCGPGNTCTGGLVCIDGGCMPDQRPVFTCATEGVQDRCASGSLCLHHSCYIGCAADASNACLGADKFNVCKQVTTSTGKYSVCGSNSNLGTECDPTQGKNCASPLICIDGFCR